jgi:hypothetical protein
MIFVFLFFTANLSTRMENSGFVGWNGLVVV